MRISRESWIIAAIGLADLVTTIIFINRHGAQEANPLFRHVWAMGPAAFVLAKVACIVGPLCVLEWARRHRPRFVRWASQAVIVAYLMLYGIGYMQLNGPAAQAAEIGHSAVHSYPSPFLLIMRARMRHLSMPYWQVRSDQWRRMHPGIPPMMPAIVMQTPRLGK
ncbi:MAG TPA: DUF5658 family protein [Chthonomonadaceae bacterium]|nr:DUF5658 family protein [Chthonomonadaceae bacterium]